MIKVQKITKPVAPAGRSKPNALDLLALKSEKLINSVCYEGFHVLFSQKHLRNGTTPLNWPSNLYFGVETSSIFSGDDQICSQANQRLHVKGSVMSCTQYIAYYRVSTVRQGESGLGLDAQRAATAQFLMSSVGNLVSEYTEVESGKLKNRPELDAAVEACRKTGATLLIAKLDRLARNVAFIANLLESGVKFIAVDMPNADRFILHVYAAMAEEEARRIGQRTKAALQAAKLRGVKLGKNGKALARENRKAADAFANEAGPIIDGLLREGGMTFRSIAEHLNSSQLISTPRNSRWHESSVFRVHKRFTDCTNNRELCHVS